MFISEATVLCFGLNDSKLSLVFENAITSQAILSRSEVSAVISGYTF